MNNNTDDLRITQSDKQIDQASRKSDNDEHKMALKDSPNQAKSRSTLSQLECSEVLSSGKKPETFDLFMQPLDNELNLASMDIQRP